MINLYSEKDYENALKTKKKMKRIYFIVLGIALLACAVVYLLFLQLPYESNDVVKNQKNVYLVIEGVLSFLILLFSFVYLGIPYQRAKAYFTLMNDIKTGQKQIIVSTFLSNEEDVETLPNVDYRIMVVLEWSDKTQDSMRPHVLVDKEKKMPELQNGDIITYVTHANVLLSYGLKADEDVFDAFENNEKK